jgi:hypothetical protein
MTGWGDLEGEMQRFPLDIDTADRLLSGSVLAEDAPPGYAEVAKLLAAASAGPVADEPLRDTQAVAVLAAAVCSSRTETTPSPRRSYVHRLKLATAVVVAGLACTTGLAFADGLPGAAQDVASAMLAKVGITVPGPDESAGTHPNVRGKSSPDVSADIPSTSSETASNGGSGKGQEISELARTTELTGVDKGAAISTLASDGKSQAGQHGQATEEHGAQDGAATADTASGGHSTAGSGNASAGQSHRP